MVKLVVSYMRWLAGCWLVADPGSLYPTLFRAVRSPFVPGSLVGANEADSCPSCEKKDCTCPTRMYVSHESERCNTAVEPHVIVPCSTSNKAG